MLSLASLRKPLTRTQALAYVTEKLTALGFQTTSWADGSIQKTFLMTLAIVAADGSEVVKSIADGGFNSYAKGVMLKAFSRSRYDNEYVAAVATAGPMTLTSVSSVPNTINVGDVIAATSAGVEFRNTTGGVLAAGSTTTPTTLILQFEARKKGAAGNVAADSVTRLLKPLAGVTISNPGSPWYSTTGADEESDASLQARNRTKWSTLTVERVKEAYEAIARDNGATKVKVNDQNPRGPGTIDVYPSSAYAVLGTSDMEAIQLAFSEQAFATDSAWADPWPNTTSRVATKFPPTAPLDIVATVYFDSNEDSAEILAAVTTALQDFLTSTPIGGWDYSPGPANVVLREDITDVIKAVPGVRTVVLTTPSATVSVGTLALVTQGTWTLTMVAA